MHKKRVCNLALYKAADPLCVQMRLNGDYNMFIVFRTEISGKIFLAFPTSP